MGVLDAVGYVGDSIDKLGARPLRGVLGGRHREALSFIPFSDRVGITDPNDIVSGRELTDRSGLTTKGDQSLSSHALGFGAEMALDPLNFVGGLGVGRHAAKGAKEASALAHSDDLARLSSHARPRIGTGTDLSLGLKYDEPPRLYPGQTSLPFGGSEAHHFGLDRADPEWVNNRTFYHGTATPDLNPSNLNPLKTDPRGLYGKGIYTTDEGGQAVTNPSITSGYAKARSSYASSDHLEARKRWVKEQTDKIPGFSFLNPEHLPLYRKLIADSDLMFPPPPVLRPQIYQSQSDFGKILDVYSPLDSAITPDLRDYAKWMDASERKLLKLRGADSVPRHGDSRANLDSLVHTAKSSRVDNNAVIKEIIRGQQSLANMAEAVKKFGGDTSKIQPEIGSGLIRALTGQGYDAITHTGGVARGGREHQVVIGLDPNDVLGVGRKAPYREWSPFASLQPGALDDLSVHPSSPTRNMAFEPFEGNASRDRIMESMALGPRYPGGPSKLAEIFSGLPERFRPEADAILRGGLAERIAGEFPAGSRVIGAGAEAAAMSAPHGGVIRIGRAESPFIRRAGFSGEQGRPNIPEMLQPVRTVKIGPYRVEHLPAVSPIDFGRAAQLAVQKAERNSPGMGGKLPGAAALDPSPYSSLETKLSPLRLPEGMVLPHGAAPPADLPELARIINSYAVTNQGAKDVSIGLGRKVAKEHGLHPWDVHDGNPTNVSITRENRAIIHDGGSIWPHSPSDARPAWTTIAPPPELPELTPELIAHLEAMGAHEEVRRALSRGFEAGTSRQGVPVREVAPGVDPGVLRENMDVFRSLASRHASNPFPSALTELPPRSDRAPDVRSLLAALNGSDFSVAPSPPLAKAVAQGAGGLDPRFKALRDQFQMYKDVPLDRSKPASKGVQGLYKSNKDMGAVFQGAVDPARTLRHEVGHGIVDQAVKAGAGRVAALPPLWQPGAWAKLAGTEGGGLHSLGRYLDEVAQHSTENRGLLNQLKGGVQFATDRGKATRYASHLAADNPLLKALIMSGPWAKENQGKLALSALASADLARLASELQGAGAN